MNKPLVSVVVITYNHEDFIAQALDSIFLQKTNFTYEVLVGDDASQDNTATILKEYETKYPGKVRLFLNPQNLGATRNAYEILMKAKGKYIATLEGDDYWLDPHKLQKQTDFLEKNPKFIGCCHKFNIVDRYNTPINKKLSWVKHKPVFTLADFKGIFLPSQPSTFVRHNIFLDETQDYRFIYKTHPLIGDRTSILLFLSMGNFYCFNEAMGIYRINAKETSITNQLYTKNTNAVKDDYEYTKNLEKLARDVLHVNVKFTHHKCRLFIISIVRFCKRTLKPTRENR